jgi:hypothetical protein
MKQMMRQLKSAVLLAVLCLAACATRSGDYPAASATPGAPAAPVNLAATPYYVEFHSRPSVISGHTYLVYGAQDEQGNPKEHIVVGFYPVGGIFGLLGGMVAAPGRIDKTYLDEKIPDMNIYRRNITADQYQRLNAYIDSEKGKTKVWNMFVNNCNDFAADAAKAIGLKVPSERFMPPALFIMTLGNMNEAPADERRVSDDKGQGSSG